MFKTISECRLELVEHSVMASNTINITMLDSDSSGKSSDYKLVSEQDCDFMPCSAARASFGNEDKTGNDPAADVKLMKYLADHQHMTPFEYQHATFLVEVPLFIRSQIHRHRTFSYNEISRRYTSEDLEFWVPDKWRGQHKSSKQASSDAEIVTINTSNPAISDLEDCDPSCEISVTEEVNRWTRQMVVLYNQMLRSGVAREQARAVLPQSLLTRFYMGGNLRNWAHFIELRRDAHAQLEVQVVANRVADKLRELWPESCRALGI